MSYQVGVCVVVLDGAGRVLISERRDATLNGVGSWACPGGSLEPSDAGVVAGAKRELLEETGLELVDYESDHVLSIRAAEAVPQLTSYVEEGHHSAKGFHYVTLFVIGRAKDASKLVNTEPHKHGDWQWVAPIDFPTNMWSRETVTNIVRAWGSDYYEQETWSKEQRETLKSRVAVAYDGKRTLLLDYCGPDVNTLMEHWGCEEAAAVFTPDAPGVWVGEGVLRWDRCDSYEDPWPDYEPTFVGEWRAPTDEEWEALRRQDNLWEPSDLPTR